MKTPAEGPCRENSSSEKEEDLKETVCNSIATRTDSTQKRRLVVRENTDHFLVLEKSVFAVGNKSARERNCCRKKKSRCCRTKRNALQSEQSTGQNPCCFLSTARRPAVEKKPSQKSRMLFFHLQSVFFRAAKSAVDTEWQASQAQGEQVARM